MEDTLYLTALLAVSAFSATIGTASWRKRDIHGAAWLAILLGAISFWTLMQAASLVSVNLGDKLLYHNLMFIGISLVPVTVFCFVMDYYHLLVKLPRPALLLFFAIPLMTMAFVASDSWHHLFYSSITLVPVGRYTFIRGTFGLWFWVHSIYSYLLVVGTLMVLGYKVISETGEYRRHSLNLIGAMVLSSLINVLTIAHALPIHVDMTPFTFILVGGVFYVSLFRSQVFELGPITKDILYENIREPLVVTDPAGIVVEFNPAFTGLFDVPPARILGRSLLALVAEQGYDSPDAAAALSGAHPFKTDRNRSPQTWQVVLTPLKSRSGHTAGTLHLFRDMTEINTRLAAADQALVAAAAAKESITRNLSDMSHEIRTPLMGIMGAANLLKTDARDSVQRSDADRILAGAETLLSAVNRVLDYSKLEAGKMNGFEETFPLSGYLKDLDALTGPDLLRNTPKQPETLTGNRRHLLQVMQLIHRFLAEAHCPDVRLTLVAGGGHLLHTVNISSLSAEGAALLSQWHRLDDLLTEPWHPDPLNMVLATRLAAFIGSELNVSQRNGGWQLQFRFPYMAAAASPVQRTGDMAQEPPRKLLFAEDSPINQAVIRRMLKNLPYALTFASDGQEALTIASEEPFDAIFTDIHMPGIDGLELSYRLQETLNRNTPIFALSSDTNTDVQKRIEESPIRALVVKPCPKEQLIRLLQEHSPASPSSVTPRED